MSNQGAPVRNMSTSIVPRTSTDGATPSVAPAASDYGYGYSAPAVVYGTPDYGAPPPTASYASPAAAYAPPAPTPIHVNVQNSNVATATAVSYGGGSGCYEDSLVCTASMFVLGFCCCWPWAVGAAWLPAWVEGGWPRGMAAANLLVLAVCVVVCIIVTVVVIIAAAISNAAS